VVVKSDGRLVGALPLYEKYDSYGEYIFDWSWARAATQAGIEYYPKLVSAVPFTPASGPRLLLSAADNPEPILQAIFRGLNTVYEQTGTSSIHILFHTEQEQAAFQEIGLAARLSHQFHWNRRPQWHSFDDYLASMRASKRKQIKKERNRAQSHGLKLEMVRGEDLNDEQWQALYMFYRQTCHHKGAIAYLNLAFFNYIQKHMASSVMASLASLENTTVAGSLFFRGEQNLFGRYWGCIEDFSHLHFELCYYLPIEWSFQNGIHKIEAGAQGEHKISRGFDAAVCYSSHHMKHAGLWDAIQNFLKEEALGVTRTVEDYRAHSSFKSPQEED
jgi:predicted N-acyltransferase